MMERLAKLQEQLAETLADVILVPLFVNHNRLFGTNWVESSQNHLTRPKKQFAFSAHLGSKWRRLWDRILIQKGIWHLSLMRRLLLKELGIKRQNWSMVLIGLTFFKCVSYSKLRKNITSFQDLVAPKKYQWNQLWIMWIHCQWMLRRFLRPNPK